MAPNKKRTGQNDKVFSLKTTPGAGRRVNPKTTKPKAKPAAKPADAKPALSSEGVRGYGGKGPYAKTAPTGSSAYNAARNKQIADERERLKGVGNPPPKAKPSPKPSTSPAKAPAPAARSTTTRPADKVPSSASKTSSSNVGPVASGDEYARNKDPKKYNPLMQKTFGYQKGDSPSERNQRDRVAEAESQANKARVKQGPADPAAKPNSITAAVKKQNEERKQRRRNQMM